MATQERPSLVNQIRKQIALNRVNGDRENFKGGRWRIYESSVASYDETFRLALGTSIASFVKDRKSPVVVDLMAPSFTLLDLFVSSTKVSDRDKFGLAVSLEDKRSKIQKWFAKMKNVQQIAGDIMLSSTWRDIDREMQGRKADLIIERAVGGLNILPQRTKLYAMLMNKAWQILSDQGGIMLLQTPFNDTLLKIGIDIQNFVNDLRAKGIDAEVFGLDNRIQNKRLILKLVKTAGSPEKIPF